MNILSSLFRKKLDWDIPIQWDMHNHLLFGIDDGAETIHHSLNMARNYADLGFKKITCTPHIIEGYYPNSIHTIEPVAKQLQQHLIENELDIEIDFAAEYYLDESFWNKIKNNEQLLCIDSKKHVLVETAFMNKPSNFATVFFDLSAKGYIPILAHPERYIYLQQDFEQAEAIFESGIKFQINMLSILGHYAPGAKKLAEWLIEKGYYHFIASDAHHVKHLELLPNLKKEKIVGKIDWNKVENAVK